ncbi:hypothetical protein AB0M79_01020 [Polymorphospora sp. NPDC051019]|uniref:hypothetical protein n=1 Tax=Polymorphospora sp. NPDC051019 TaxID=3155725 RepID=UPI0034201C07
MQVDAGAERVFAGLVGAGRETVEGDRDVGRDRRHDPGHKQKIVYRLTEPSIQLVPVLAQLGAWGVRHLPVSPELAVRARLLADGGPSLWDDFMDELRELHLGIPRPAGVEPVFGRLTAAYQAELARAGN